MEKLTGMHLLENESVVWKGHISFKALIGWLILGLLLTPFVIGLIILLYPLLVWYSTEYCITNKRIYCKFGILSRTSREIEIERVSDITFRQSLTGRILDYGDLYFSSFSSEKVKMMGIAEPLAIQAIARSQSSKLN